VVLVGGFCRYGDEQDDPGNQDGNVHDSKRAHRDAASTGTDETVTKATVVLI
jgi:hypothetical protein